MDVKRIVICCDGTWNTADQESAGKPCPTNVVRLAYRTAKRDDAGIAQIVFYDQGVGTGNRLDQLSGGAFGDGLEDNIYDAYRFLIANYEAGDALFLFGFSRGAYTARSLAGLIRKCGILTRRHVDAYREALALYRDASRPDDPAPTEFRRARSIGEGEVVRIRFIGVWDTVGALGIPLRGLRWVTRREHQFHDTHLSGAVDIACQALAIDEHRAPFEPTLWTNATMTAAQTIEQMWFCGAHADVGGGYAERGLSDIALAWMLERAAYAGLALDASVEETYPVAPDPLAPLHASKAGLYALTPGIDRAIGPTDPTQSLHASVRERWDRVPQYRPQTLKDYFKAIGDPRAA